MDDAEMEEIRAKIKELVLQRDAYQLMEDGIKKLEEYNILATKINNSSTENKWHWRMVYPVIFKENSPPDVRNSGIYTYEIGKLTSIIIGLNNDLMVEFRKRKEAKVGKES